MAPFPARLSWSPDGRTLATDVNTGHGAQMVAAIYPDGSCLNCQLGIAQFGEEPGFTSNPTVVTAVGDQGQLFKYGVDGLIERVLLPRGVSDPAWSARGELAVVRAGWIWVGTPRRLERLIRGDAPSWSPDVLDVVRDPDMRAV